jgi:NADPH-dependent 2,4-dienoyl-CoA reductase/sulfur reductase-like enzyme
MRRSRYERVEREDARRNAHDHAAQHLLRLRDGADRVAGIGALARFMDAGLVYGDGARIRITPVERLPLR